GTEPDWVFQEIDVARVRLIRDFSTTMEVPEETMPLVLSLLDQVYTLRGQMRAVARAVEGQPEAVRAAILAAIRG
ncbi:MAG: chaperone modulatory protein CbpM, partial [Acetobacteraceae bacterium]|nr:chaperone modulatory protein CbpM [Acetobacteraceae bacterium]